MRSSADPSLVVSFFREGAFGVGESDDTQTALQEVGFGSDRASRLPVLVGMKGGDMGYSCTISHCFEDRKRSKRRKRGAAGVHTKAPMRGCGHKNLSTGLPQQHIPERKIYEIIRANSVKNAK